MRNTHSACSAPHTFSTCTPARTYDTCIEVLSGSCGALTSLGCNDDGGGSCGLGSTVQVPVVIGQTYLIRVGGFNGSHYQTVHSPQIDEDSHAA